MTAIDPPRPELLIDLAGYFGRIGFDVAKPGASPGLPAPTLETLARLQFCHACAVPFENLDVLLYPSRGIAIDLPSVQSKIVSNRRGGYCFEQNGLLLQVLRQIGFEVSPVAARVRFGSSRDQVTPRTHLFCRVLLDGVPYLVDVGVGGLTPTAPLRLDTTEPQATPHDVRRIVPGDASDSPTAGPHVGYHQVLIDGQWRDVCDFLLGAAGHMAEIDRVVANWWTSTNPHSKFRQSLMAALALPDGSRLTLNNRALTRREGHDGVARVLESRVAASREEVIEILHERFGLRLPKDARFGVDGL